MGFKIETMGTPQVDHSSPEICAFFTHPLLLGDIGCLNLDPYTSISGIKTGSHEDQAAALPKTYPWGH